jgi:hypothetical protein
VSILNEVLNDIQVWFTELIHIHPISRLEILDTEYAAQLVNDFHKIM